LLISKVIESDVTLAVKCFKQNAATNPTGKTPIKNQSLHLRFFVDGWYNLLLIPEFSSPLSRFFTHSRNPSQTQEFFIFAKESAIARRLASLPTMGRTLEGHTKAYHG